LLLAASVSCASVELMPVEARRGAGAVAVAPGVEVRASATPDERPWAIPSGFTPVRISVRNTGPAPVYVALDDIQLAGGALALRAVAPGSIPPRRRVASLGMDPGSPFIARQSIGGAGARYGRTESVLLEPPLGSSFESSFGARDPARAEIVGLAFREGSIADGETRQGLVYFRHVPPDAGFMTLRIGVRPTAEGERRSIVEIVYAVQS
jgi:hypothetical protein